MICPECEPSSTKHSPTPWKWQEGADHIYDAEGKEVFGAPSDMYTGTEETGSWLEHDVCAGNMRLGAAAPGLLAALELARDTLADLPEGIDVDEPFKKIEAAIASTWEK